MLQGKDYNIGIMFRREHAPELLPDFARQTEEAGFDELWVVEDCFYASGIVPAAVALSSTNSLSVGVGIMPAVARNAVFTAMEISTLARMFPGRFLPGLGHGMAHWMRQIGAFPKSQMAALEETAVVVRKLLGGESVSFEGQQVQLDKADLVFPPQQIPPISLGVRGPKSLALSGRVADGTILAEFTSPAYVAWAREQIALGTAAAGHGREQRLTVFSFANAGATTDEARNQVRPLLAKALMSGKIDAQLAPMGILPEVKNLKQNGDVDSFAAQMPDEWIDQLVITGTRADWKAGIERLVKAGADSVVLVPLPDKEPQELAVIARHLA